MKPYRPIAAAAILLASCGGSDSPDGQQQQAPAVEVATPFEKTVELYEVYTGRFEPVEEVELRSRVSGYVESVKFEEGQQVEKGALMFQIDPRPFDAQVAAAEAQVKQAEARVNLAKSNLTRAENLVTSNAISREEADIRRSEFAQSEADLLAAEAELDSAQLDREFANVDAPIAGIAGEFLVTPGNFISGGTPGSDLLTTIVPHDPIHCVFEVDERQVLKFTRMYFEGKTEGRDGEMPTVQIAVSDREDFEFEGKIDFTDNRLDESTATIQLRAIVQNENQFLTPGLFAKVKVRIGEPFEATLVQDSALGYNQSKRYAWLLQEDGTVQRKFVQTGELEGDMRIVESGLTPQDKIVVSGIQILQDGMKVNPTEVPMRSDESEGGREKEQPEAPENEAAEKGKGDGQAMLDSTLLGGGPNPVES